jgi:hypothetical protein
LAQEQDGAVAGEASRGADGGAGDIDTAIVQTQRVSDWRDRGEGTGTIPLDVREEHLVVGQRAEGGGEADQCEQRG